ncbi:MAG: hypothetical protein HRU00_06650 [Myxococcales bacterium]|nr:hypothetical protein [Myxococcales bacterium]
MPAALPLPGDAIGPGVTEEAARLLSAVAPDVEFERGRIAWVAFESGRCPREAC